MTIKARFLISWWNAWARACGNSAPTWLVHVASAGSHPFCRMQISLVLLDLASKEDLKGIVLV